jgi:hypothetical protein
VPKLGGQDPREFPSQFDHRNWWRRIRACTHTSVSFSARLAQRPANGDSCSTFLKKPGSPNIPIQAIGLSLYEQLGTDPVEQLGTQVTRTQWLDLSSLEMENLIGKNVLIVDEVDDTRTTLEYAVSELQKDVAQAQARRGREGEQTKFSIFVLHVCNPVSQKLPFRRR